MTEDEEIDDDADGDDVEGPGVADRNDEPAEVTCDYCLREIPEDVGRCPYCGSYLAAGDPPRRMKPWWWIVAVIVLVLLILRYTVRW